LNFKTSNKGKTITQYLETHRAATSGLTTSTLTSLSDFLLFQISFDNLDSNLQREYDNELGEDTPSLESLFKFIQTRARSDELRQDDTPPNIHAPRKSSYVQSFIAQPYQSNITCSFCQNSHQIYACDGFRNLTPGERFSFVKQKQLCMNCLSSRHSDEYCRSNQRCRICEVPHHSLLHADKRPQNPPSVCSPPAVNIAQATPLRNSASVETSEYTYPLPTFKRN
jgi:hypothetical protein